MKLLKTISLVFLFVACIASPGKAQVEGVYIKATKFEAAGIGGFLNVGLQISQGDYITAEGGFRHAKGDYIFHTQWSEEEIKYENEIKFVPVLLGYRYTVNRSGRGFYIEPYAGYNFSKVSFIQYEQMGWCGNDYSPLPESKIAGPTTGLGVGYLFKPVGRMHLNLALRYDHSYGEAGLDVFALRLSHSLTIGRKK